jgi:predicted RNA-binding protein with PIN domain
MIVFVDGHNVLGRARIALDSVEAKRELLQRIASWARRRNARVTVVFDGVMPPAFGTALGGVRALFAAGQTADDRIVALVRQQHGACRVVTSDAGLAARVRGRNVNVISADAFAGEIREQADEPGTTEAEDWDAWFSDPKNRGNF